MNKKEFKIIKDKMFDISNTIVEIKNKIITEEATKQSLILPFFQALEYNVFNPLEFSPEYTAGFGIKKGEKVDYAITLNNKLSILVEAKSCNVKLDKYGGQLSKYKIIVKNVLDEKITELAINKIKNEMEEPLIIPNKIVRKVVTTEEELVAYGLLLGFLSEYIDIGNISYKDTENYFSILLLGNVKKWICRLYLNGTKKYVVFADFEKIFIDDIGELCDLKTKLFNSLKLRVEEENK